MADKHLSTQFDSELNALSQRVMELGGLAEAQIRQAIYSLAHFNEDAARQVMETETRVNQMEIEIEGLEPRHQPRPRRRGVSGRWAKQAELCAAAVAARAR